MEKDMRVMIVCIFVSVLGLLSAATGFAAEAMKIKPSQIGETPDQPCVYPRSAAFPLGLTAALSLLIAHVVINLEARCTYHGSRSFFIHMTSLATFVTAFIVLLNASLINDYGRSLHSWVFGANDDYNCHWVEFGVFTKGALFSLSSILFSLSYYLSLISAKKAEARVFPAEDPLLLA